MATITLLAVSEALKPKLEAAVLSDGAKCFDRVELFAQPDLATAFQELRVAVDRLCLIIPTGTEFENLIEGRILCTMQRHQVTLLFTDRVIGNRPAALTGNGGPRGILNMAAAVTDLVIGSNLGIQGVIVMPTDSQPFAIQGADRQNMPGREGWQLDLGIAAGAIKRGTTLHRI